MVIEKFSLYADKAKAQIGSEMETSQLIGALRYVCDEAGVEVVMQGAHIKQPTRAQMKARGVNVLSGISNHANDAVLHLWYYLLTEMGVVLEGDLRKYGCN